MKFAFALIAAFLVGAIAPLLGLLLAAFIGGMCLVQAQHQPRITRHCDPELYAQIEQWTEDERQKLRLK